MHCAVGLWIDITVNIFSLPSLDDIQSQYLGSDTIPRSIMFANLEQRNTITKTITSANAANDNNNEIYLLCGLGDGSLVHFVFDTNVNNSNNNR